MKLRNVALAAAVIFAALSFKSGAAQAGGDMSGAEPERYADVERTDTRRQYYRAPYGADYGPAYGRTYIYGSYYRPYRLHHYSYALPNYYTHYYPRRWYNHRYYRRIYRGNLFAKYNYF